MHRRRSGYRRERDAAISHIDGELVTDPTGLVSLGVLLRPNVTDPRQITKTLFKAPFALLLEAFLLGSRPCFGFL